jgi:VPDSG-CTERM motif
MDKKWAVGLLSGAFISVAHAFPVTSFTTNSSGGFGAVVYPTLADGTFTSQSAIFTLPFAVNPGYVIIVDDPTVSNRNTSNWSDVIRFIGNGTGKATTMQMFTGGPDQTSYFPSLAKVMNSPHVFITESSATGGGFTDFTDYSVSTNKVRNYRFYTAAAPLVATPDSGSTLTLLGVALCALFFVRKKLASRVRHFSPLTSHFSPDR